jgi:hypothetical protein
LFSSVGTIRHQPVCGGILQFDRSLGKTVPEETFPSNEEILTTE